MQTITESSPVFHINPLDPGDKNCENYAFRPYSHLTPQGQNHELPKSFMLRLNDLEERGESGYWRCECGTQLEFYIPLDSDME